jgi:mRNA-degrading endonuclease RelE of RelBE toxin-antitoxin system
MSYEIVFGQTFKENVRRLGRRFPHVKADVGAGIRVLMNNPRAGVVIPQGHGARKLRLLSSDLRTGKRGGFRLIYLVEDEPSPRIYLLLLYAKPDRETVSAAEIERLLAEIPS